MNHPTSYYATTTGHAHKPYKEKTTQPIVLEDHKIIYQMKFQGKKYDPKIIICIYSCQIFIAEIEPTTSANPSNYPYLQR